MAWYAALAIATVVLMIVAYVLIKSITFMILLPVMAAALVMSLTALVAVRDGFFPMAGGLGFAVFIAGLGLGGTVPYALAVHGSAAVLVLAAGGRCFAEAQVRGELSTNGWVRLTDGSGWVSGSIMAPAGGAASGTGADSGQEPAPVERDASAVSVPGHASTDDVGQGAPATGPRTVRRRLDELAMKDDRLARTFILAKVLATLLIEDESHRQVATGRGRVRPDDVYVVRSGPDLTRLERVAPVETWSVPSTTPLRTTMSNGVVVVPSSL